jgi:hypothetical protein
MTTKKLRRKLMGLCFSLLTIWIITTFSQIVLWYAKGGAHGFAPDVSDIWQMFVFYIIPALTSGYLLCGLFLLNWILKSKKSDEESSHDV